MICTIYYRQQFSIMSTNFESQTVCCGLFTLMPPVFIEESFDENDHQIVFVNKSTNLQSAPTNFFYSSRVELTNSCFLLTKICHEKNISIVLTYNEVDNKRTLVEGILLMNNKKCNLLEFSIHEKLELGDNIYENVGLCVYSN